MKKLIFITISLLLANTATASSNDCAQGVRAAYETYLMSTLDAKHPDMQRMTRTLDFRLSQQPFKADEAHAFRSLGYISKRLKDAGRRAVLDYEVAAVAGEYINRECRA